jgi:hypothetical protein
MKFLGHRMYLNRVEDLEELLKVMKENEIEDVFTPLDEAICVDIVEGDDGLKYVEITLQDWE